MIPAPLKIDTVQGYRLVWVDSRRLDEALALVESSEVDGVFLSRMSGFNGEDLPKVCRTRPLKAMVIYLVNSADLSVLSQLSDLEMLQVKGQSQPLNLKALSNLRKLTTNWTAKTVLPEAAVNMTILTLSGFKPKSGDLEMLFRFAALEELALTRCTHRTLDGFTAFTALRKAEFNYCRNLVSVSGVSGSCIQELILNHCPKVTDLEALNCPGLSTLHYVDCRPIQSLVFLKRLIGLREFTFVGTDVIDGDLSPLVGLRYSGFIDKRHFSHTYEEIRRINNTREGCSSIDG